MTGHIEISVVLPVYNAELYLPLLISSLFNQSASALEVIAVDDGSTNRSLSVLKAMGRRDARLCILSQDNGGCSAARNRGLEVVRGRWIAFADAEDWLVPRALETWRRRAERAQLELLIGNGFCFNERPDEVASPHPLLNRQPWGEVTSGMDWIMRAVAAREWPHRAWLQLVSRELISRTCVRFIEGIGHQDIPWTTQLAIAARRVGFAPEPFYGYRINPSSTMHNPSTTAALRRGRSYITVIEHLTATADCTPRRSSLRRALLRQANRECGQFLGVVRTRLQNQAGHSALAREFLGSGLAHAMFRGARDGRELWRALRCWTILRWYAATAVLRGPAADQESPMRGDALTRPR
jgi:hypothetical protein